MNIILTSSGIQSKVGKKLIHKGIRQVLGDCNFTDKTILVMHEERISRMSAFIEGVINNLIQIGFTRDNIVVWHTTHEIYGYMMYSEHLKNKAERYDIIYVGEGNAINMAFEMQADGIMSDIRYKVNDGALYIGSSAGAMLAGKDVLLAKYFKEYTTGDIPEGLNLLKEAAVVPHFTSSEYKRFVANLSDTERNRYRKLYSVPEGKILIFKNY